LSTLSTGSAPFLLSWSQGPAGQILHKHIYAGMVTEVSLLHPIVRTETFPWLCKQAEQRNCTRIASAQSTDTLVARVALQGILSRWKYLPSQISPKSIEIHHRRTCSDRHSRTMSIRTGAQAAILIRSPPCSPINPLSCTPSARRVIGTPTTRGYQFT
jgi:hypothetical protein